MRDIKISKITAREVLDSRGNPTIAATAFAGELSATAMVPSGVSTGTHEALELRDRDSRYNGKGVLKAVSNINNVLANRLFGEDCTQQREIDNTMIHLDGTDNKTKLGGNSILAVSMAVCRLGAMAMGIPLYEYIAQLSGRKAFQLPVPQLNVINGGKHADQEDDIQEHSIMPVKAKSFAEGLRMSTETYYILKGMLHAKYGARGTLIGDEGGFVPPIGNVQDRLAIMSDAINAAGYRGKIKLAIDCAASEFYKSGKYNIGGRLYTAAALVDFYEGLCRDFDIISIEDGMAEDDWAGWAELTRKLGRKVQIIGDDLTVTNVKRIKQAIEKKAMNSLILKLNQIGTVSEAIDAANLAFRQKWAVVVSHRSGETEDTFIADTVVGLQANQSKFGAPARSERTAKYNRLMQIEAELGKKAVYARM
jgi:enolase